MNDKIEIMIIEFQDKSFVHEVLEDCCDLIDQIGVYLDQFLSVDLWTLELHVLQLCQLSSCLLFQESETNSVSSLGSFFDSFMSKFIVSDIIPVDNHNNSLTLELLQSNQKTPFALCSMLHT